MPYNIHHREEKEKSPGPKYFVFVETQDLASLPFYGEITVGKIIDGKVFHCPDSYPVIISLRQILGDFPGKHSTVIGLF